MKNIRTPNLVVQVEPHFIREGRKGTEIGRCREGDSNKKDQCG